MKQRKTIAVDIDDVLARSAEGFVAFSNERWGMQLQPEDYQEEWAVVWGVPLEEALRRSIEFHSSGVVGGYQPYEAALPVLRRLAIKFDLVAVTSRKTLIKPETDRWLDRHFPHIFREVHYAGIWDKQLTHHDVARRLAHTKAEVCRQIGADYLIDDQPKHCIGAAKAGIKAILFGDYKWNRQQQELPEGVTRARHWDDVLEYFRA